MSSFPAHCLLGKTLKDGWEVIELITRNPLSTGGKFSVGYKVKNRDGHVAFLKALDFSAAAQAPDPPRALQQLLEAYNFERDLLDKCRTRKLNKIMIPIQEGSIDVPGFGIFGEVYYLIFELASGDIREVLSQFNALDLVWCLRSLHNVAVGLQQLHTSGIAHQDLKPSNVLVLKDQGEKIGDLGRASDQTIPSPHDHYPVPGDRSYAPLDLYYNDTGVDGFEKRFLADAFLLGSLFFFHFSKISASHAIRSKLRGLTLSKTSFKSDLPYFQHAFEETLVDFKKDVEVVAGEFTDEIVEMVKQLCDPDPTRRGDPKWKGSAVPKYDLQRYISKLDLINKKLQVNLK